MYKTEDFNYFLPPELIAQNPVKSRDKSRLLVLDKNTGLINHDHFFNIINFLNAGDILVLNNSKVFPARLIGKKLSTSGKVEIFLHQQRTKDSWECLVGGKVKVGLVIILSKKLQATLEKNNQDGTWLVKFNLIGENFFKEINKIGLVPLPPYIKRDGKVGKDKKNYQTVFADDKKLGSVAAPTAGLHFTKQLLKKIKNKGVKIQFITLHVGLGTFAPVKIDDFKKHKMHRELVSIKKTVWRDINEAKNKGNKIVAVGTTSCRALESAHLFSKQNKNTTLLYSKDLSFWTDIFIYPGYKFKLVDGLVTNFHLPKSTLLMLVSALAGKKNIEKVYQVAVANKYRFYSYGDAMFIK